MTTGGYKFRNRRLAIYFAIVACFAWLLPGALLYADSRTDRALAILEEIDDLWRAESSQGIMTMRVETAHYTRTLRMESWSKGKEMSLVRILSPKKEKGTASLKSGNTLYTYLPKTDRTIRLTSGMMMGSWMGSHFTNDDLVKESRLADDFVPAIEFEGRRDGLEVMDFSLTPKPDAPVVWGRIVITVRASDRMPLISRYYDEDMVLARTVIFDRVTEMGGRKFPAELRVLPEDKPGEYTELVYEEMRFGIELDDGFFSLLELRRR